MVDSDMFLGENFETEKGLRDWHCLALVILSFVGWVREKMRSRAYHTLLCVLFRKPSTPVFRLLKMKESRV